MFQNKPMVIIVSIITIFLIKLTINSIFDKSIHKGPFYKVKVPVGWQKEVQEDEVSFYSPDTVFMTGQPEAIFSIYAIQSKGALFIENVMTDVVGQLNHTPGKILDQGEIKIDRYVSKWILFRSDSPKLVMMMFFVVDDFNRLTRIQYTTVPEKFKDYRPAFEAFKDSIKFKGLF